MKTSTPAALLSLAWLVAAAFAGARADEKPSVQTFAYGEHPLQQLDVLAPSKASALPVVVFIHGGGWMGGNKSQHRFIQERLAAEGIVTVSVNYRLAPEVVFPAFVEDGASAVAWVRKHIAGHGGDPDCLYLMGHSAGGHTVSLLGLDENYLNQAQVPLSCIKAVIPISAPLLLKASQVPQFALVFGAAKDEEMWPLAHIDGREPPFLILQGNQDRLVQPIHAKIAERSIRAKGGQVTCCYFEEHDHLSIIGAFSPRLESKGNVLEPILKLIRASE